MKAEHITYGTLALSAAPAESPSLVIVQGGLTVHHQDAIHMQCAAPDVYARIEARPASRAKQLLMGAASALLLVSLALAVISFGSVRQARRSAFIDSLQHHDVIVEAGQSLWDIAEQHPVDGMPASEVVELMRSWNGLDSSTIHPGMELSVPFMNS